MPDELLAGATATADFLAGLGAGDGFDSQHLETTMRATRLSRPSQYRPLQLRLVEGRYS